MQRRPLATSVAIALLVFGAGCTQRMSDEKSQTDAAAVPEKPVLEEQASAQEADAPRDWRNRREQGPAGGLVAHGAAKSQVAQDAAVAPPSAPVLAAPMPSTAMYREPANREKYAHQQDHGVVQVAQSPVSTFSIDVDTGSYSNVRRMLNQGQLPPADAVRAEEWINYFDYGYQSPDSADTPFRVTTELAPAPWNPQRHLLLVGIQGYEVAAREIPASNLVFLIDTSGSMQSEDKIGLLKRSFQEMVKTLRAQDRVSIVVYAGSAGLVLPPTPGDRHEVLLQALEGLEAGGSTNGGAGIELAYAMARRAFIPRGVNRVVLATDGDFNVGTVDTEALKTLVADKRKSGVALTTLGFGQDNYNDELAEQLADIGNGNHAYIDTLAEGRKVLVEQRAATLLTIAKDVKVQLEFNPVVVAEYRLIGYENRALRREDFNNDQVDAGEIGAGHDVTALYELTLAGSAAPQVDPLRYGSGASVAAKAQTGELGYLRLRYKRPRESTSRLVEQAIALGQTDGRASERLQWASAVAGFADALRGGTHLGGYRLQDIIEQARTAAGNQADRRECLELMQKALALQTPEAGPVTIAD